MPAYRHSVLIAADEAPISSVDAVHINCSVAGVCVLVLADGSKLPVQLVVGVFQAPYAVKGYVSAGSSGTFSVYGLTV